MHGLKMLLNIFFLDMQQIDWNVLKYQQSPCESAAAKTASVRSLLID
jgi:hypothetical protein